MGWLCYKIVGSEAVKMLRACLCVSMRMIARTWGNAVDSGLADAWEKPCEAASACSSSATGQSQHPAVASISLWVMRKFAHDVLLFLQLVCCTSLDGVEPGRRKYKFCTPYVEQLPDLRLKRLIAGPQSEVSSAAAF